MRREAQKIAWRKKWDQAKAWAAREKNRSNFELKGFGHWGLWKQRNGKSESIHKHLQFWIDDFGFDSGK